jgi:ATP-dependent Clp protease ATP-binding subunit ClpC
LERESNKKGVLSSMFEKYTEKARRVIFFARYEASQFGQPYIETEHLMLGILREDKALTNRFLRSHASVESIRKQVEEHTTIGEKVSTSVDLPLSNDCKRVLTYAAEEAEQLGHKHVGTEHLLLGLLREDKCFAAQILHERGLRLLMIREELAKGPQPSAGRGPEPTPIVEFLTDLVQAGTDGQLLPVIGRDVELEGIIEILSSYYKRSALLIGEPGAGKTSIVHGLAQRIANAKVPSFLANKRILAVEPEVIDGWTRDRQKLEELTRLVDTAANPSEAILFIDRLQDLFALSSKSAASAGAGIVKQALLYNRIQCIGTVNVRDYAELIKSIPWFEKYSRPVYVRPLDQESSLRVLQARKGPLESFHDVTYTAEALEFAVHASAGYLPERSLPGKAVELLDAAGSLVRCQGTPPDEVAEAEKRLKFISLRFENAIANHEFEKARFFSDEERKQKENLRVLRENHHLSDSSSMVGRDQIQEVISRWSAYPYCP